MVQTEWVSGIDIDEERQTEIQSCFANKVEFHSAKEPDELIDLIEKLKLRTRDIVNNTIYIHINELCQGKSITYFTYILYMKKMQWKESGFGEKIAMDRLIVMDGVSGIADHCKKICRILDCLQKI